METAQASEAHVLVDTAHQGIDITYFDRLLQRSGMAKGVLASLIGIDPRTIDNYRKKNRKFDILEGELILKLERLFVLGEDVFEDMAEFIAWLDLPSIGLGNRKPMLLLNTSTGIDLVYEELMRTAHGYVV